jgi:hypothetical protein
LEVLIDETLVDTPVPAASPWYTVHVEASLDAPAASPVGALTHSSGAQVSSVTNATPRLEARLSRFTALTC